jgi:hypothetical protein
MARACRRIILDPTTPARVFITDRGILKPPYRQSIRRLLNS